MMADRRQGTVSLLVPFGWAVVTLLAASVIWSRLALTVDLAFFLPGPSTEQEKVLMDRLGQGPGSQLLFISLHGRGQQELRERSRQFKSALVDSGLFSTVLNGQEEITRESIPPVIWNNRFLLDDIDWTVAGLQAAFDRRLADLAVLSGTDISELIAADPFFSSIAIMERLAVSNLVRDAAWIDASEGVAYQIAESIAPAFDMDAQSRTVELIRATARKLGDDNVDIHGMGAYGVGLQTVIRNEARYRSLLATIAIVLVLLAAYRRPRLVILGAVPLMIGGLVGLAVVTLLFGTVHGITLAFGFTLFGVAIDYPLHLFSHARTQPAARAIDAIWPTLRLGAGSTVLAYLAIAVSGSRGLAQLGCLSAVGVLVAMYATRSLLPMLMRQQDATAHAAASSRQAHPVRLGHAAWLAVLLLGMGAVIAQGSIWTNDLSSLTPLSPDILRKDRALRVALGAPDIRHLVSLRSESEEQALRRTEYLQTRLEQAERDGLIDDARLVTQILPSRRTQQRRREQIPDTRTLQERIDAASAGMPFRDGAFTEFIEASKAAKKARPITAADFEDSVLESFVDSHFYFDGAHWGSFATLHGLSDPDRLSEWLSRQVPDATLVDLKAASESLVSNYRLRIHVVLFVAFVLIAVVLLWRLGTGARLLWVLGTLASAIVMTVALNALVLDDLSIFNLIALVLVAGLGLDYALFMSRPEKHSEDSRQTRHAIRVCAASTLVAFCILAVSSVPILASLGITVASGVLLNFLLAWLGTTPRKS